MAAAQIGAGDAAPPGAAAGLEIDRSRFLVGAAIGSGITALAAEHGGADLLLAINAGRFRSMGAPSIACMLPILDAATLTGTFARGEVLTQCKAPVLVGVNVWGERFNPAAQAIAVRDAGFAGAVNFPSCMHYSRPMQQILSRAGRGIEQEVEMLRAVQALGLTAMFYCATRTQARLAADAGIDFVCLNLGWNVGGSFGHRRRASIEEVATVAREIGRLIKRISPGTRFLLEGGPIETAEDLGRVVALAPIDGYVGGSTIERIPLEESVADRIDRFRRAGTQRAALDAHSARLVQWSSGFGFVGESPGLLDYLRRLRALARAAEPVLVVVEQGGDAGPSLAALAPDGARTRTSVVHVDVAAEEFPGRARRILFGHRDTLDRERPALADPAVGLLAVDAPERLPAATQARLLGAVKERAFRVTGTRTTLDLSTRVVLVCRVPVLTRDLAGDLAGIGVSPALVEYFRGWTLRVPPLRERIDDLAAVVRHIEAVAFGTDEPGRGFSTDAMKLMTAHRWPGNEEEVRAVLGALAERASVQPVQSRELAPLLSHDAIREADRRSERDLIVDALWRHGFNRTRTAAALGVTRKTLYNKIRKYGLSG